MAAGVAHELNQPLTVVETTAGDICLRLMEGMPLETDELREMMENIRGVVDRMAGTVDIRTRVENDAVVIEVEDNGVGMDEATRQRLFEPFFTTKDADRGTGLGLSIIYAIVRNHDGQITVENEEGLGTTFRVVLPVMDRCSASI